MKMVMTSFWHNATTSQYEQLDLENQGVSDSCTARRNMDRLV